MTEFTVTVTTVANHVSVVWQNEAGQRCQFYATHDGERMLGISQTRGARRGRPTVTRRAGLKTYYDDAADYAAEILAASRAIRAGDLIKKALEARAEAQAAQRAGVMSAKADLIRRTLADIADLDLHSDAELAEVHDRIVNGGL